MDTVLMQRQKLELSLLSESVVQEKGWYTDTLRRFDDGLLVAHGEGWPPAKPGLPEPGTWRQVSRDGGATWQPYTRTATGPDYTLVCPYQRMTQRRDGSVIGWARACCHKGKPEYKGCPGQPFSEPVVRASSWGTMLRGESQRVEATIWVPHTVPGMADDFTINYGLAIWGKMVETENRHLVQAAHLATSYDVSPRIWAGQPGTAYQLRTGVIYSQDEGVTWHYLATVASPREHPLPAQSEGYCEPDLLSFGEGRLLCVMRSGGNPGGALSERFSPLMAARSSDGGLSWTPPTPISAYGVCPVLLQMQSGLVVCLSGRPSFFLLFSADEGRTWSVPHWVSESHGPFAESSSGYGQLIELEPGVLGVAYDEYIGSDSEAKLVTKFRRYRIYS